MKNTHSPSPSLSMDYESTTRDSNSNERLILPPISTMNNFFASRSWPPPSSIGLLSPSAVSTTSSNVTMQDMSNQSPSARSSSINNDPWSPIPNFHSSEYSSTHQPSRLDYFTSTPSSSTSNTLPAMENHYYSHQQQQQQHRAEDHHHRLPKILTRGDSMTSQHNDSYNNRHDRGQETPTLSLHSRHNSQSSPLSEFVLSPSIGSIEKDIDEVIKHCNYLATNMNDRRLSIVENDGYFSNPTLMRPWLDDMISKANEVLNALLRLRKQQLAAEYARLYKTSNHQQYRGGADGGHDAEATSSRTTIISLNASGRLRKRGKRPVFQGRCHSCNISETPEWRRGPDGARTLCNACGLHYAKLAKKKNKQREDAKQETLEQDKDDTSMK